MIYFMFMDKKIQYCQYNTSFYLVDTLLIKFQQFV